MKYETGYRTLCEGTRTQHGEARAYSRYAEPEASATKAKRGHTADEIDESIEKALLNLSRGDEPHKAVVRHCVASWF